MNDQKRRVGVMSHRLRTALPYGLWACVDGREVLFNRYYDPIWQRVGGVVLAADPDEWVKWTRQVWFYNGDTTKNAALYWHLEAILAAFQSGTDVQGQAQVAWTRKGVAA